MEARKLSSGTTGKPAPQEIFYPRGEAVFHQGDIAKCWFEVCNGLVRTCRFHTDGHRHLTGFHFPGDVFGIDWDRYPESAEAVVDTKVLRWRRPADEARPNGVGSEAVVGKAFQAARRSILIFGHRSAEKRVAAFIAHLSDRTSGSRIVELPMDRADIGDYLGLSLHTVSRTITRLERLGLIVLLDAHRLKIIEDGLFDLIRPASDECLDLKKTSMGG